MASSFGTYAFKNYELEPLTKNFEDYKCEVCLGLLDTPVKICDPEGHLSCLKCANRLAQTTRRCPECSVKLLTDFYEDKNFARLIKRLSVKCPAKCDQNINVGDIEDHLSRFCTKTMVTCDLTGCQKKMPASELDNHKKNTCDYRSTACLYCGVKYIFKNQDNHLAFDCEILPKKVKLDCGESNIDMGMIIEILRSSVDLPRFKALPGTHESASPGEIPPIFQNLFSPSLPHAQLVLQFTELKKMGATIAGVSFDKFSSIRTLDISKSHSISEGSAEELVIIHGTFDFSRRRHWMALEDATFAGSLAPVQFPQNEKVIFPDSGSALVTGDKNTPVISNKIYNWHSRDVTTDMPVVTNPESFLGAIPAVFLRKSSLLGIVIDCNEITQGIAAVHGTPLIAHCIIKNSKDKGILFYDVDDGSEVRNTRLELAPRLKHPGGIVSISRRSGRVPASVLTSQNTITHKN